MNKFVIFWSKVKELMIKVKELITKVKGYVRVDGLLHIMASAIILLSLLPFIGYLWSLAITIVAGIAKELVYDLWLKKGTAEWHDIICDAIGIVYASVVFLISLL